ncbi:MAG: hypothetical protein Q9190_000960, partial [Brigantiaea leucoxantha]
TIYRWNQRLRDTGSITLSPDQRKKAGRRPLISPEAEEAMLRFFEQYPMAEQRDLVLFLNRECGVKVDRSTVSRVLKRRGKSIGRNRKGVGAKGGEETAVEEGETTAKSENAPETPLMTEEDQLVAGEPDAEVETGESPEAQTDDRTMQYPVPPVPQQPPVYASQGTQTDTVDCHCGAQPPKRRRRRVQPRLPVLTQHYLQPS